MLLRVVTVSVRGGLGLAVLAMKIMEMVVLALADGKEKKII